MLDDNVVKMLDTVVDFMDQHQRVKEVADGQDAIYEKLLDHCGAIHGFNSEFLSASGAYKDNSSEVSSETFLCALGARMASEVTDGMYVRVVSLESMVSVRKKKVLDLFAKLDNWKGGNDGDC